jgi:hypothetical protein
MVPGNPDNSEPQIGDILKSILNGFLLIQILVVLSFSQQFHALLGCGQCVRDVPEYHYVQRDERTFDCCRLKKLNWVVHVTARIRSSVVF